MKAYIVAILIGATLAIGVFVALRPTEPTYADLQRAQLAAEQAQALAPVWTIAQAIVILGGALLIIGIPTAVVVAGLARFRRNQRLVAPAGGIAPLLLDDNYAVVASGALQSFHATQRQLASVQPVPHTYSPHTTNNPTYSPHLSYDYKSERLAGELVGEPLLSLAAGLVPSFAELLTAGRIGRGLPLLMGINQDTGDDVQGSWLDLYSTIVSGLPGSGKTTSQRFLACQTALQGAKFVIVDPHAGAADDSLAATLAPLHSAFLCQPASDDQAILSAVQLVADIGGRRVRGQDTTTYPIILWLDETTSLLSRSKVAGPLAELIEEIAQEFRKKNVFACASGQIWSASRTGDDSALRDSFASVICHRMKRSQARLLVPTDEAQRVERLGTGQALLWRTSGETTVIGVPNTTAADVVRVAGLLTDNAPTITRPTRQDAPDAGLLGDLLTDPVETAHYADAEAVSGPRDGRVVAVYAHDAASASERARGLAPEAARIVALFKSGANVHSIVGQVYEQTNTNARSYKEARARVEETLRTAMSGI